MATRRGGLHAIVCAICLRNGERKQLARRLSGITPMHVVYSVRTCDSRLYCRTKREATTKRVGQDNGNTTTKYSHYYLCSMQSNLGVTSRFKNEEGRGEGEKGAERASRQEKKGKEKRQCVMEHTRSRQRGDEKIRSKEP